MRFVHIECGSGGRSSDSLERYVSLLKNIGVDVELSRICEEDEREHFTIVFESEFPEIDSYILVNENFYYGRNMKYHEHLMNSPKRCDNCNVRKNELFLLVDERGPLAILCMPCLYDIDLAHRFIFGRKWGGFVEFERLITWRNIRYDAPRDGKMFFKSLIYRYMTGKDLHVVSSPDDMISDKFDEFRKWVRRNMRRSYPCWFANYVMEHDYKVPIYYDRFFELSHNACLMFLDSTSGQAG